MARLNQILNCFWNLVIILLTVITSTTNLSFCSDIQDKLQKNIVLCTGPSLGRKDLLVQITTHDIQIIPFKKIFIATNDPNNLDILIHGTKTSIELIPERDKQLDCLNCIIRSIKMALKDPEITDDDIILFKHESVYISDMYLITQAIKKVIDGYDIVVKYWLGKGIQTSSGYNDYYHTDSFFISVKAARQAFKDIVEVSYFTRDYQFCEEYFSKYIVSKLSRVYKIDYHHSNWKDNELGFYHLPRYQEDPNWYWDKKNYYEIY